VLTLSAAGVWSLWPQAVATRVVCVAATDLPAYHEITNADIRLAVLRSDQVPENTTADPTDLLGRYTVVTTMRDEPFDPEDLGPRLAPGALTAQVIVGFSVPSTDIVGESLQRGDRIDILLSSTSAISPRTGILSGVTVLNIRSDDGQAGQVVVVCAFARRNEATLLAAYGTARILIALVPPSDSG
jgi:Flp pilus assembly protein CpaB